MCGYDKCSVCQQHNEFLEQNAEEHRKILIRRVLGKECLTFIDSGIQYDMYPVNESSGSKDDAIEFLDAVCDSINEKNDIEFAVIEQAYELLDPSFELNEYYGLTLAKFMAKKGQEGLVEFIKGKTTEELVQEEEAKLIADAPQQLGIEQPAFIGDLLEELAEIITGGEEE